MSLPQVPRARPATTPSSTALRRLRKTWKPCWIVGLGIGTEAWPQPLKGACSLTLGTSSTTSAWISRGGDQGCPPGWPVQLRVTGPHHAQTHCSNWANPCGLGGRLGASPGLELHRVGRGLLKNLSKPPARAAKLTRRNLRVSGAATSNSWLPSAPTASSTTCSLRSQSRLRLSCPPRWRVTPAQPTKPLPATGLTPAGSWPVRCAPRGSPKTREPQAHRHQS